MSPAKQVKNILETGTQFDYKHVDFTKHDKNKVDCTTGDPSLSFQDAEDGGAGLIVGDTDIPVRDEKYINQRQQRFDDAPTFEEES